MRTAFFLPVFLLFITVTTEAQIRVKQPTAVQPSKTTLPKTTPPAPAPAPAPTPAPTTVASSSDYYISSVSVRVYTGTDAKEAPSMFNAELFIKPEQNPAPNSSFSGSYLLAYQMSAAKGAELRSNTNTTISMGQTYSLASGYHPDLASILKIERCNGVRFVLSYIPNFPTDAWKIDRIDLILNITYKDGTPHPFYGERVISFLNPVLLTSGTSQVSFTANGQLMTEN